MEITPEIRAQLDEQKKQCIFCKLISGEQEAKKVFEDDLTFAALDIYPAKKGHVLFMLKEHYPIMPYIPPEGFKHFFGLVPDLTKAIKEGMASIGVNVFMANGGVAGQTASHFLIHVFPRDEGDSFTNFRFDYEESLDDEKLKILKHNFPIMMGNHFQRNPSNWHVGEGQTPVFLKEIYEKSTVIYEDEKVLCVIPVKGAVQGHIKVYSKTEEKNVSKLSNEDSSHLFFVASFAATLVFEGLKVQGTNIILKSGISEDNSEGRLLIDILPRMEGDSLKEMMWKPKEPSYNVDEIKNRIKEHTWEVGLNHNKEEVITKKPKVSISSISSGNEIKDAIERLKR